MSAPFSPVLLPFVVVVLALAPALALAQTSAPILLERTDAGALSADVGAPAVATFELFNLNREDDFFVSVVVEAPEGWDAEASPNRFFIGPRNATEVEIRMGPREAPRETASFTVTFNLVDGRTGAVTPVVHVVEVSSEAPPRVVAKLFPNPLPAPLDNALGSFLVEVAFAALVAVAAMFLVSLLVQAAVARAERYVKSEIAQKLRRPVFYFVFFIGLARALRLLPRSPVLEVLDKLLVVVAVTFFGLQVVYRLLDAGLYYYQQVIAPRTKITFDDILVPVIRKVGLVAIYIVGIVVTLRNLGWDPTIVFAGAGIAGLVIAFAAQDTFSNLFSGLFLLLDRPFVEGDQIQLETGENARVENIGLRTTRLYNEKIHETVIVPNNQLATKRIINHSAPDRRYRVGVDVNVAYGTDPKKVERVLLAVAGEHPKVDRSDAQFGSSVRFRDFGESGLLFSLRVYIPDFEHRDDVTSDLRFAIDEAFKREGIQIPFPHRTVVLRDERKTAQQ